MSTLDLIVDELRASLLRILPAATVLLSVMVLLRGISGSIHAIKLQLVTLATSFLGAEEGMVGVLLHTLPLAIAAAVAAFAIARGMIRFESQLSLLALALIVIMGASVGGFLRQFATAPRTPEVSRPTFSQPARLQLANASSSTTEMQMGHTIKSLPRGSIAAPPDRNAVRPLPAELPTNGKPDSPIEQLKRIDWLAQPDLSKAPLSEIKPLALLPQASGIPGAFTRAINQLLAYLVAYQPRLFLAAIVAGSWVGWSCHRRLTKLTEYAAERCDRDDHQETELRRAA